MTAVVRPTVAQVNLVDGANTAAVDATGHVSVVADALPLPSGAATQATLEAIRVLEAASRAVTIAAPVNVSQPGLSGGILQSVTTVGATAVPLPATPLAGRATMLVQSDPANTANIYLGASTVTANTATTGGIILLPGQSIPISLSSAVLLYARSTIAAQLVRTFEVAA